MKDFLDKVGPGFCLAKWTQATIHLGTGLTHSCHHTKVHHIDADAVKTDPSALHNTQKKNQDRTAMLHGHRLPDCNYCWRVEDTDSGVSDRVRKSSAPWSTVDQDAIINDTWREDINYPRSLEVSFSNVCNFACAYCGPTFSSKWHTEIEQQGPYHLTGAAYNNLSVKQVPNREHNPYIEAFWKWFPDIVDGLYEFRITGGEPLMSNHTFDVLDLLSKGKYNLDLGINTNGNPTDKLWQRFIDQCQTLEQKNAVNKITVYPSAEATGQQAEYIRDGLDWNRFKTNIEQLLESTENVKVSFMSTVTVLSLPTLPNFCDWVIELKDRFGSARVKADLTQIKHPPFLDPKNFPTNENISLIQSCIEKFENTPYEKEKLTIIKNVLDSNKDARIEKFQTQLNEFTKEYDKRRNKHFSKTFA